MSHYAALQMQKAVSAYLLSEKILPFGLHGSRPKIWLNVGLIVDMSGDSPFIARRVPLCPDLLQAVSAYFLSEKILPFGLHGSRPKIWFNVGLIVDMSGDSPFIARRVPLCPDLLHPLVSRFNNKIHLSNVSIPGQRRRR